MEKESRIGAEKQKLYRTVVLEANRKLLDRQVGPHFSPTCLKVFVILGCSVQGIASIECLHFQSVNHALCRSVIRLVRCFHKFACVDFSSKT